MVEISPRPPDPPKSAGAKTENRSALQLTIRLEWAGMDRYFSAIKGWLAQKAKNWAEGILNKGDDT